jgi:hypothetical protein
MGRVLDAVAAIDVNAFTVVRLNAIIREDVRDGRGLFAAALQRALTRHGISVPFCAHDLIEELDAVAD